MNEDYPILTVEEAENILDEIIVVFGKVAQERSEQKREASDGVIGHAGPVGPRGRIMGRTLPEVQKSIQYYADRIDEMRAEIEAAKRPPISSDAIATYQITQIAKRFGIECNIYSPHKVRIHPIISTEHANQILEKAEAVLQAKRVELHNLKNANLPPAQRLGMEGRDGFCPATTKCVAYRRLLEIRERIKNIDEQIRVQTLANDDTTITHEILSLAESIGVTLP